MSGQSEIIDRVPKDESAPQQPEEEVALNTILPLEVIDKSIGQNIKILLTNDKEFHGTLVGFDDYVNVVLENVQEYDSDGPKGKIIKKMLLNGGLVAMLVPSIN
ncbi:hypothetical protein QCA50_012199 [Cerrena zonata]|uniref:LSM complex subunit LSM5 n=2 Tax=Dikarya TaxID=451864 RepID=A0A1E4RCI6_9ASCO|nr:hypothetical protein HYPBUDRAFT_154169 [Hyphopichia burtonii NRRL Y-1933]ODV64845.1 hypothetical protein HYPBUDRAFT_154169 [Hyphopichia burtonii NRRL Y-1933]